MRGECPGKSGWGHRWTGLGWAELGMVNNRNAQCNRKNIEVSTGWPTKPLDRYRA